METFTRIRQFVSRLVDVTEAEWLVHRQALVLRRVKKGQHILQAGEVCSHVHFINVGCFRTYNILNDEEYTSVFAFEGDYTTDYKSFLTRQPCYDNIVALEDAETLALDYDAMQRLYEAHPVWQKYGRLIAEFIFIETANRSQSFLLQSPEQRYLEMMKTQPRILDRVPLKYIASFIGITPEALSRIRRRITQSRFE